MGSYSGWSEGLGREVLGRELGFGLGEGSMGLVQPPGAAQRCYSIARARVRFAQLKSPRKIDLPGAKSEFTALYLAGGSTGHGMKVVRSCCA